MKKKNRPFIYALMIMGLALIVTNSCKKKDKVPTVETVAVSGITYTQAASGGTIASDGGSAITAKGVCWSTGATPTIADSKTTDGSGADNFTSAITGLNATTTYYIRAYATNSNGTGYGSTLSFTTATAIIGDNYQGGTIYYLYQTGDPMYIPGETHGLIAAPADQSTGIQWYNGSYMVIPGAYNQIFGTGNINTDSIVYAQGAGNYAAKLCYDLVSGGYSDWYLPDYNEILELYLHKSVLSGIANDYYWSSTEVSNNTAYNIDLTSSVIEPADKSVLSHVRAIRKF